ncbi:MAG: hypothetical protein CM15mP108_0100 [Gammaproteobacteria bacterium]|nr:MAG: hypothetical protein CM15mP108_0100 [Gammaproteobacteria bacterium]
MKTKVLGKNQKKLNFSGKDLLDSIPRNRKRLNMVLIFGTFMTLCSKIKRSTTFKSS